MENEIGLLTTVILLCVLLRMYVTLTWIGQFGLGINASICVLGCFAMFSAMIVSNIFGNLSLTVICALLSGICLLGLVISCIILSMSAEMDRRL